MGEYIICRKALRPSKVKGQLPDVISEYLAETSHPWWEHDFTRDRSKAFIFPCREEASEIAELLNMEMEEVRR